MRLLLDNNLDIRLPSLFPAHQVGTVRGHGWRELANGDLLKAAEELYEALITGDKNMPYQTNVKARNIGVYVLDTPDLQIETIEPIIPVLEDALLSHRPGTSVLVAKDGWRRLP